MPIRSIVVQLEIKYLQDEAKRLRVSRTKLVRVVMEKILRDELVPDILSGEEQFLNTPRTQNYRRLPERHSN
jgi:hypothetical protein